MSNSDLDINPNDTTTKLLYSYQMDDAYTRQQDLSKIQDFINNLNTYLKDNEIQFSNQHINNLKEYKRIIQINLNEIENRNKYLVEQTNNYDSRINELQIKSGNIDAALNSATYAQPNNKLEKIIIWADHVIIRGILFKWKDGYENMCGDKLGTEFVYNLNSNEFIVSYDLIQNKSGFAIYFYTTNGRELIAKTTSFIPDNNEHTTDRVFIINKTKAKWEWHRDNAKKMGYKFASIRNMEDNQKIYKLLKENNTTAWVGGRRKPGKRGRSGGSDTWYWDDGTPWTFMQGWPTGLEPNDCCGGEDYLQVQTGYNNGITNWNDLFPYDLPAIYYYDIKRSLKYGKQAENGLQILGLNFNSGEITTDAQYINDDNKKDIFKQVKKDYSTELLEINTQQKNYSIEYQDNLNRYNELKQLLSDIDKQIKDLTKLNEDAETQGFTNMKHTFDNLINNFFNLFNYNKDNMSFKEGFDSKFIDIFNQLSESVNRNIQSEINQIDKLEYDERRNYMFELATKRDNVLADQMVDYIVNNDRDNTSSVEAIYSNIKQQNNDNMRKIQLNNYMNKVYKEYIYLLKIIIFAIVLIVPFIFLNKFGIFNYNLTMFFITFIIVVTVLYILYRMILLRFRDNYDYDKIRQTSRLHNEYRQNQTKNDRSGSLSNLKITCIGQECCTDGMLYDNTNKQCVYVGPNSTANTTTSGFRNFHDTMPDIGVNELSNNKNMNSDINDTFYYLANNIEGFGNTFDKEQLKSLKRDMLTHSLQLSTAEQL